VRQEWLKGVVGAAVPQPVRGCRGALFASTSAAQSPAGGRRPVRLLEVRLQVVSSETTPWVRTDLNREGWGWGRQYGNAPTVTGDVAGLVVVRREYSWERDVRVYCKAPRPCQQVTSNRHHRPRCSKCGRHRHCACPVWVGRGRCARSVAAMGSVYRPGRVGNMVSPASPRTRR